MERYVGDGTRFASSSSPKKQEGGILAWIANGFLVLYLKASSENIIRSAHSMLTHMKSLEIAQKSFYINY